MNKNNDNVNINIIYKNNNIYDYRICKTNNNNN